MLMSEGNKTPSPSPLSQISLSEVKSLLKRLDTSKATCNQDFPTWVSLDAMEDICLPLHNIINAMLTSTEFPNKWKQAHITPIPMISMPSQYKHFRPISLHYHLGKLAEDVVINKLKYKLTEIVDVNQFAYQSKIGTVDAVMQLVDDITNELDKPNIKCMQLASVDFSKAFDRLQPAVLVGKMKSYCFNLNLIQLVQSFLDNRQQCVKYNGMYSSNIDCKVGTPQGTKFGPILWLIYCNDLVANGYSHIKYADGTSFFCAMNNQASQNDIVPALRATQMWSADNSMLLNTTKTAVMNMSLCQRSKFTEDIHFDGSVIKPMSSIKFLGVTIDSKFSFNEHISNIVSSCNSRLLLMRKLKTLGLSGEG